MFLNVNQIIEYWLWEITTLTSREWNHLFYQEAVTVGLGQTRLFT